MRATDTLFSTTAQFQILRVPTSSNGTTFGPGSANNLLKSNGTSVYWTTLAASDIPNLSTDKLTSGTLGVARGGTGATSFTANSVIISGNTTTAALTTRAIYNRTTKGNLEWTANTTDTHIITKNTLAYWDGSYSGTSSNLTYCVKGAFGNAVTYGVDDATANGALGTGTDLTTERSVYYGLVTVNNASQTRATGIYAPTSAGTANQILVSAGGTSAPTWKATANGAAYATNANGALTFGTLPIAQGGTGQTSVANIQAGKDGDGNTISSTYLKLSGGTLSGNLYAGTTSDTTQRQIGAKAASGSIYFYSSGTSDGARGIWIEKPDGTGKNALHVNSNNIVTLAGHAESDLALTGGTLTGTLRLNVSGDVNWFESMTDNTHIGGAILMIKSDRRWRFRQMTQPLTSEEGAMEDYILPAPTQSSGYISYDILTTKSSVLVTQGGTGATTPAAARANLQITPANIKAVAVGADTSDATIQQSPSLNLAVQIWSHGNLGRYVFSVAKNGGLYLYDEDLGRDLWSVPGGAVNKSGDTMTGNLAVRNNVLAQKSDGNYNIQLFCNEDNTMGIWAKQSTNFNKAFFLINDDASIYLGANTFVGRYLNDTVQRQLGAASGAGNIFFYVDGTNTGYRGIWTNDASLVDGDKNVISIDQANNITLNGHALSDLALTGGTLTGDLIIKKSSTPYIIMQDGNGVSQVQWAGDLNQHKGVVIERHTGDSGLDFFYFPAPSATGNNVGYDLLSTKNVVTVAQGGTSGNGLVYKGKRTASDPLSSIHESGYWAYLSNNLPSDKPTDAAVVNALVINYHAPAISTDYQIYITFSGGVSARYERRYYSTWSGWKKVTYTATT